MPVATYAGAIFQELFSKFRGDAHPVTSGRLRVLSLSCVFPNTLDPQYGIFVRSRLQALGELAEVRVFAPIPLFDWARYAFRRREAVPEQRQDGNLQILHPRWFYPPLGGGFNAIFLFFRLLWPMLRLRAEWQFDLIDSHFAYPDGIAAAMLSAVTGVPFSITLRGNEVMHARLPFRGVLIGWALRRAARVIAVSESLREFAIRKGVAEERVKVIPNGVHTGTFFPHDREAGRRKFGFVEGQRVILSAGSLIERKGHHHLIEALKELPEDVVLVIAGGPGREGSFEAHIRRMVAGCGYGHRIRLLGAVPPEEMGELMSAADLLCLASSREGWPNVVHEAMACGTPVVAAAVGGVPEMIQSEEYGLVVPANNQSALTGALRRALEYRWNRQKIAGWAHSRPWDKVAREVLRELQDSQSPKG